MEASEGGSPPFGLEVRKGAPLEQANFEGAEDLIDVGGGDPGG